MSLSIGGSTRRKLQLPVTCISTRVDISCCRGQSWSPHRTSIYIYDVLQLKLIKRKGEPSSANYTRHRRSSVTLRTGKGDSEAWTVAMKALLLKTGSFTTRSPVFTASMGVALSRQNTFPGVFSGERTTAGSPRLTLHLDVNRRNGGIRRALSESDMIKSVGTFPGARSLSSTSRVPDEVHVDPGDEPASLTLEGNFEETWKRSRILVGEVGFCGSGFGDGSESGGYHGSGGGSGGSRRKMGDYYLAMLKSNPGDPLLLRNYGKYLHEVERDFSGAEEYYGRAILASPGDGEVLSLYGKLIWETQRDGQRAGSYFDQAVQASPEDSTVLGSYAHFMWEAEEDEDEEIEFGNDRVKASPTTPAMMAF